eukprot:10804813-Alexandrium_andersonii.AAC.1
MAARVALLHEPCADAGWIFGQWASDPDPSALRRCKIAARGGAAVGGHQHASCPALKDQTLREQPEAAHPSCNY